MKSFNFIAIIYNPNSTGKSQEMSEDLAEFLRPKFANVPVQLVATEYAGHAEKLAYDLAKKHGKPLLISASGDGGYNEVINGAVKAQNEGTKPVCAVLPAGNANDHHKDTKRTDLRKAIVKAETTKIDLLEVEITNQNKHKMKRYAHSYIGLGLTPTVAIELNRHDLDAFKELYIVLKSFMQFRPFKIEVEEKILNLDSLIISHIGRMAKVINFENSGLDDGVFEVTIFPHGRKMQLLWRLVKAVFSGLKPDERKSEYKFKSLKPMPMQLDGEVISVKKGSTVKIKNAKQILTTVL